MVWCTFSCLAAIVPTFCPRYNPEHDSESRLLRHRAVALQDMAHSILDHELSEDFERVRQRM